MVGAPGSLFLCLLECGQYSAADGVAGGFILERRHSGGIGFGNPWCACLAQARGAWGAGLRAKGVGQMTEGRGQMTEAGGQKTDDGRQNLLNLEC